MKSRNFTVFLLMVLILSGQSTLGQSKYIFIHKSNGQELGYHISEIDSITFADDNGNVYPIVKIGNQWWMAENLKVTHYRNGEVIPNVTDNTAWSGLTTGAYCEYDNNSANLETYGRLYNWYAVNDSRNIAPTGWHVPTDTEWQTLINYLGGDDVAGGKLKEAGTTHWSSPNEGATNESGFTALPGGYRNSTGGTYHYMGEIVYFWVSTEYSGEAGIRCIDNIWAGVDQFTMTRSFGFSVRCVRDE